PEFAAQELLWLAGARYARRPARQAHGVRNAFERDSCSDAGGGSRVIAADGPVAPPTFAFCARCDGGPRVHHLAERGVRVAGALGHRDHRVRIRTDIAELPAHAFSRRGVESVP